MNTCGLELKFFENTLNAIIINIPDPQGKPQIRSSAVPLMLNT